MKLIFDGERAVQRGRTIPGEPCPETLITVPLGRIRKVAGEIVDAAEFTAFHVDSDGFRWLTESDGRQEVQCAWDDEIVKDGNVWRVASASDQLARPIKLECERRIFAVASANTQMNVVAAMAAGRLDAEDTATYAAGLDWIDAMRATCDDLIAAGDADYAHDAKWPPLPPGVADLVARF